MGTTGGILNRGENTRPPFFIFLWRLLRRDATFRGAVEFAVIGVVIYFFLVGLDSWQQPQHSKSPSPASAPSASPSVTTSKSPIHSDGSCSIDKSARINTGDIPGGSPDRKTVEILLAR